MNANNGKKKCGRRGFLWVAVTLVAILAVGLLLSAQDPANTGVDPSTVPSTSTEPSGSTAVIDPTESNDQPDTQPTTPTQTPAVEQAERPLDKGLTLVDVGKYIGIFMEDGTDEVVANVLMLLVRNDGKNALEYAEITVQTSAGEAHFSLSTLPAGESVVLLEKSRMEWSPQEDYSHITVKNVVEFSQPLSLHEDQLSLQVLDGVINITNISGADIAGDIVIYYKNSAVDLLYGGITYRVHLQGGLKAGEIRQIVASHFSESGSRIMFVSVG